jgi:hypothetical protein
MKRTAAVTAYLRELQLKSAAARKGRPETKELMSRLAIAKRDKQRAAKHSKSNKSK